MSIRYRHAPTDWIPGQTRVRYTDDVDGLRGAVGTFEGNSLPVPGNTPRSWMGVLVRFDGWDGRPFDVDPADLEVLPPST